MFSVYASRYPYRKSQKNSMYCKTQVRIARRGGYTGACTPHPFFSRAGAHQGHNIGAEKKREEKGEKKEKEKERNKRKRSGNKSSIYFNG